MNKYESNVDMKCRYDKYLKKLFVGKQNIDM